MNITTVGIDLAKSVFQVHAVDERGKAVLRKTLKRAELVNFFAKLLPCLIGMEACGSAHFWARKLTALGHTVKLMAPQFVKPYVKTNKNDARDAEAICEAAARPNMRFVPIKSVEQQALLGLHRARQGFVAARTAQANQLRGLLSEFGVVIPGESAVSSAGCRKYLRMPRTACRARAGHCSAVCSATFENWTARSMSWTCGSRSGIARAQPANGWRRFLGSGRSRPVPWSAVLAMRGSFKNGRQLAAWLGLVPRQASSGGKERLLGISKRGDTYLRTLLIHGARSVLLRLKRQPDQAEGWLARLIQRRNPNIAAVALANKNARIVWALLAHERDYQVGYVKARIQAAASPAG